MEPRQEERQRKEHLLAETSDTSLSICVCLQRPQSFSVISSLLSDPHLKPVKAQKQDVLVLPVSQLCGLIYQNPIKQFEQFVFERANPRK